MLQANVIKVGEHDHEQCAHIFQKKIKTIHRVIQKQNNPFTIGVLKKNVEVLKDYNKQFCIFVYLTFL